jgi:hypothetical protein
LPARGFFGSKTTYVKQMACELRLSSQNHTHRKPDTYIPNRAFMRCQVMKRFISLLFAFALSMTLSMSAQAGSHECNAMHQVAVKGCHGLSLNGGALASCLVAAKDAKKSCMNGDTSGGGEDPGPTPSTCESDCQASHDGDAEACQAAFDSGVTLCGGQSWCVDLYQSSLQGCMDTADAELASCTAGC